MLLENQFIHNFRYNLFTWRMSSNRVKTIGSRELLTNYSCEQIVTKLSILTRNWIEACLLVIMHRTKGMSLMWYRHYWSINNLVALHEKHPIILPHFIPSQCVLFFTSHVRFVNSIPSFFVSKTTTTSPFSFSQERFVYDLSLSLSRSILWPSGVNVKSNVQGMLSVPAHIHNFFRSCMRCLITFT